MNSLLAQSLAAQVDAHGAVGTKLERKGHHASRRCTPGRYQHGTPTKAYHVPLLMLLIFFTLSCNCWCNFWFADSIESFCSTSLLFCLLNSMFWRVTHAATVNRPIHSMARKYNKTFPRSFTIYISRLYFTVSLQHPLKANNIIMPLMSH